MTLAARLRAALDADYREDAIADDDFNRPRADGLAAAAVLIAVTDRPEPGVLLTLRQGNLRRHPGQISFPGGRVDPGDSDAIAAALREAEEEIGLPAAAVDVVGRTQTYCTGTGFEVVPVIGVVPPDLPLAPHEIEVAAVFEVPLAFLLERANHRRGTLEVDGRVRTFHEITWQDRRIWGATAGMIVDLGRRLETFA